MHDAAPLDRAVFALEFEGGRREDVIAAAAALQNPDGGFHDFDPDLGWPVSSVLSTMAALHLLADVGLTADDPIVQRGLGYLRATFDPKIESWPIIPAHDNTRPHAPWWHYTENFAAQWDRFQDNPRAEVLACLYRLPDPADDASVIIP